MDILRIPWSYYTQLEYLPDKDFNYVMRKVFELSIWRDIKVEKSLRGWLVISIYREISQMENKARAKKWEKRLEIDIATLMDDTKSDIGSDQVKENKVKENKIKESNIVMSTEITATKVATLQDLIKNTFDTDFINWLNDKYKLSKEDFKEQSFLFYSHWSEKKPNWKKEKWQMEKTFDPKLRFYKWLSNNNKWSKSTLSPKKWTWITMI